MRTAIFQRLSDRLSRGSDRTAIAGHFRWRHKACRPASLWTHLGPLAKCPTKRFPDETNRTARLEAVLLLAREPLTTRKLAKLANLADGTEARTRLEALTRQYDERGSAFQVTRVAGGYQLLTQPQFARWIRDQTPQKRDVQLSDPALETLAVVAYRQPVLRADVEAIRGVQCGELLRQLMDRDLLRIVGRSDELGRPFLYGTTRRFLQVFGLRNLDELPRATELRPVTCDGRAIFSGLEL